MDVRMTVAEDVATADGAALPRRVALLAPDGSVENVVLLAADGWDPPPDRTAADCPAAVAPGWCRRDGLWHPPVEPA